MAEVDSDTPETAANQPVEAGQNDVPIRCKDALLARTDQLIEHIRPDVRSIRRRLCIATYVADLIMKCFQNDVPGVKAFMFGSVPLRTFLPDGDIDLSIFCEESYMKDTWANKLQVVLEQEEKNGNSPFKIGEVVVINAEVKLLKCIVDNIVVDISYNQLGGLCTLNFLEKIDIMIEKQHLFKRSIMLVKAWCYYESRVLGAHHGLISTYALETLVLYIFNLHHRSLHSPLEVLYKFLVEFSQFDWDTNCLTLQGPVPNSTINDPIRVPKPPIQDPLLSRDYTEQILQEYGHQQLSANKQEERRFPPRCLNILDPLLPTNNLGRSVAKANFSRIRRAFHHAASVLQSIFEKENDVAAVKALDAFFKKTWEAQRRRRPQTLEEPKQSDVQAMNAAAAAVMAAAAAVTSAASQAPMPDAASALIQNTTSSVAVSAPSSMPIPVPQVTAAMSAPAATSAPLSSPALLPTGQAPPTRSMSPQIGLLPRPSSTPPPASIPMHLQMPIPAFGRISIEATLNHNVVAPGQHPPPPPPARVATPPPFQHQLTGDPALIRPGLEQLIAMSPEQLQQLAQMAASMAGTQPADPAAIQHLQALASQALAGAIRPPQNPAAAPVSAAAASTPGPTGPPPSTSSAAPNRQQTHSPAPSAAPTWHAPPVPGPYIPPHKVAAAAAAAAASASLGPASNAPNTSSTVPRVHSFDNIPNMNMLTLQLLNSGAQPGRLPQHLPGYIQAMKQQQQQQEVAGVGRLHAGNNLAQANVKLQSSSSVPLSTMQGEGVLRGSRETSSLGKAQQEAEREDAGKGREPLGQAHSAPSNISASGTGQADNLERELHKEQDAPGPRPQGAWAAGAQVLRKPAANHGGVDPANLHMGTPRGPAWQAAAAAAIPAPPLTNTQPGEWHGQEGLASVGRRQTRSNPLEETSAPGTTTPGTEHHTNTSHRMRMANDANAQMLRGREQQPLQSVPPGLEAGVAKRVVQHRHSSSHDDVFQLVNAQIQNAHMQRGDNPGPGGQKMMHAWPGMMPPGALLVPGPGGMMPVLPPHSVPPQEASVMAPLQGGRIGAPRRPDGPPNMPNTPMISFGALPMTQGHFPYGIVPPGTGPNDGHPPPGPPTFPPGPLLPPAGIALPASGPILNPAVPAGPQMPSHSSATHPGPQVPELMLPPHNLPSPSGARAAVPQQGPPQDTSPSTDTPPIPLNPHTLSLIASHMQTSGNPDWSASLQHMCMVLSQLSVSNPQGPNGPRPIPPTSQAIAAVLSAMAPIPGVTHPGVIPPALAKGPGGPPVGFRPPPQMTHPADNMASGPSIPHSMPHPSNVRPMQPPPPGQFQRHNASNSMPHHPAPAQMGPPPPQHAMAQMQLMSAFAQMSRVGSDLFGMSPPAPHMSHLPPIPAPAAAPVHHSPPSWLPIHTLELHQHLQASRQRDLMSADLDSLQQEFTTAKSAIMKSQTRRPSATELNANDRQPEPTIVTPSMTVSVSKPASDIDDTAGSDGWPDETFRMSAGDASPKPGSEHSRMDSGSDLTHADAGSHAGSDSMMPAMLPPPNMPPLPLSNMMPGPHPASLPSEPIPPHQQGMLPFPPVSAFQGPFPPGHPSEPHIPILPIQDSAMMMPMFSKMHPPLMPNSARHPSDLDDDARSRDTPTSSNSMENLHGGRHGSPPSRSMHQPSNHERDSETRSHGTGKDAGPSRRGSGVRDLAESGSWDGEREREREPSRMNSSDAGPDRWPSSSSRDHSSGIRDPTGRSPASRDPPGITREMQSKSLGDPPGIHHGHFRQHPGATSSNHYSHSRHSSATTPSDIPEANPLSPVATEPVSRSSSSLSGELDMPPGLSAPAGGPPGLGRTSYTENVMSPPGAGERTPKLGRLGTDGVKTAAGSMRMFSSAINQITKAGGKSTPGSGGKHVAATAAKQEGTPSSSSGSSSSAVPALNLSPAHLSPGRLPQKQTS